MEIPKPFGEKNSRGWYPVPPKPKNYCRECGCDFASLEAFDLHRTGGHDVPSSSLGGRHCRSVTEFAERGLVPDRRGRWQHAAAALRARARFRQSE